MDSAQFNNQAMIRDERGRDCQNLIPMPALSRAGSLGSTGRWRAPAQGEVR